MNKLLQKDLKGVLFDVDNCLIESNKFVLRNIKKTVKRFQDVGQSDIIMPTDKNLKLVLSKNLPFADIFKELFPSNWEKILEKYREHAPNEPYTACPGAIKAVNWLNEHGILVGLVTNRVKMLEDRLSQAGFDVNNFEFMCTPQSKEFAKPHPRAFEEALVKLEQKGIHTDQIVMFGDHHDDYYSSKYQGIGFIGVLQGGVTRQEFIKHGMKDELIINDLSEIEAVLEKHQEINCYKNSLQQTSALDGRHKIITHSLSHYFSEYALHKYRIMVEIEHMVILSEYFNSEVIRSISKDEKKKMRGLYENFSWREAYEVLQYDHLSRNGIGPTEHDVKSCELWIREKFDKIGLSDLVPFVHMFVTSEDINNLAYKSMMADAVNDVFIPATLSISDKLSNLTKKYSSDPLMGRTHVQPASPTTFGKVFGCYLSRLTDGLMNLNKVILKGKVNGAVGNYNAFIAAYPDLDWKGYSRTLCNHLGFEVDLWTDQRGSHIDIIKTFQVISEIGNIVRDLSTDLSLYAAFGTMYFSKIETHVGSSVMPHKINPWFAEVAEGNIKKANYLINCLSNELDVSRLQRDLSDHDYERSYGEAMGYVLVSVDHLKIALNLIRPDIEYANLELDKNPQIVAEAIQTILRKYGEKEAYNLLKKAFRGVKPDLDSMKTFVKELNVDEKIKKEILEILDPKKYIGLAASLADEAVVKYEEFKQNSKKTYLKIN